MAHEPEPVGTLPPKVRCLATLGCALAVRREDEIPVCTNACLKAGATPDEIMEVLRLATVTAECPGDRYRAIIQQEIDNLG
ncbi:MAG: carboxymuconolactone decarboxylase family protein [Phycisphaerae bacterium]